MAVRVLYSFGGKIGADQICYTAWEQVRGLCAAGADVLVMPGAVSRPIPGNPTVEPTLARGKFRIPYKLLGRSAYHLHDWIVARRLEKLAGQIDIVHCWPSAASETLRAASRLGIPTVLERPNAHTRFSFELAEKEARRLGVPVHFDNAFRPAVLAREEAEFEVADYLLCPSDFTAQTFIDRGFPREKLLRHTYGFDETLYFPESQNCEINKKFTALFVGVDPVRKGLHFALEAWLLSPASKDGTFLIAGTVGLEFRTRFKECFAHPSVVDLGFRRDVPELMHKADVLLLPSIEEGFGLVCVDAIGSGCVPIVSKACTELCVHMKNSLVHEVGDISTLSKQITMVYEDPILLAKLRDGALRSRHELTWTAAGKTLLDVYTSVRRTFLASHAGNAERDQQSPLVQA